MTDEILDDEAYAAWAHAYELETRQLMDEDDWLELQLTIYTQIQEYKDELKNHELGWR